MRERILTTLAMGLLVCMPLAAQRNKNAGGAMAPMGVPRGMSTNSIQMGTAGTTTRTHTVTNPAGSITTTRIKSPTGTTRTMVNSEGNKTLTMTHSKVAGSRPTVSRTFTHVKKTSKVKTAHRNAKAARARKTMKMRGM
ncbi:MAG TPA: hypothetical protein VNN08_18855 [Thermoanaerobaculia bacterium]|nr:hypothetical protein [Thermoanaerobaculia bacterium]